MNKINWGIIGCGDVTELKSGPAFNKVPDSQLVAVMRRNGEKAKDYATRHKVPKWYDDADQLIRDPQVNAIYIATPPSSHEELALAALKAGKPVYLEKPMTIHTPSAERICNAVKDFGGKLVVAHYRRGQPLFRKIKDLISTGAIGNIRLARLSLYKRSLSKEELLVEKTAWRVDPAMAGGGLFHDLSPHQLDLMYFFFGEAEKVCGISNNQSGLYKADDMVSGSILFKSAVQFNGAWCFNVSPPDEKDECEIYGEHGKISFSFFEHRPVVVTVDGVSQQLTFDPLQHVQQPMIENVVDYFLDREPNPCSVEEGLAVMKLIDAFTQK